MRRLAILAVMGMTLLMGLAPQMAQADPNTLEKIVLGKCVPDEVENGKPAPCAAVDLSGRYALLKDLVGASQYLLIPTDKVDGIESPDLAEPGAPNYFEDAWQSRTFMDKSLSRPVPRDVVGLAINSIRGRTQNQLHIHIDCVRHDVLDTLVHDSGAIGTGWAPLPDRLAGHVYEAMRLEAPDLSKVNPFALLADGQPAARADMGDETLVAVAQSLPDGAEGFYLLSDKVDLAVGDVGSGEELLDHDCGVLKQQ
jgi:CDP-diacylglycerol pyrophosphatase